ncbi:P-loop containing nucleoside triphosphate hydrolase protein [Hypoxylon crocopeplum]|nr:P-loop containing nucleoside triphosphate hydrolase protein [Hypoxylon crocopeplum]
MANPKPICNSYVCSYRRLKMTDYMVFSEEEIRYYKALLSWKPSDEENALEKKSRLLERPTGQFMFLVLGTKGCGKTSILERVIRPVKHHTISNEAQFCHGTIAGEDRPPGIEEQERGYRQTMRIEDQAYIVNALELPSRDLRDEECLKQAVQLTEAAVLVYDVKSRASFRFIQDVHNLIHGMIGDSRMYGVILVGSNSDCEDEQREVPWVEGYKLAESFKLGCTFLETSAKTGDNIDKLFPQLGKEVLELRWIERQRRDHVERREAAAQHAVDFSPVKRVARWRSWTRPWLQRRLGMRKLSTP